MDKTIIETEERVQWVYNAQSKEELEARYDVWANSYDHDLVDVFGRDVGEPFVEMLIKHTSPEARLLDVGAGTGLVGVYLQQLGYQNLVAMDMSAGMLVEAEKTSAYESVHRMILGEPLNFADNLFDVCFASGVFTYGHAPSSAFDELIRITKPGGLILFTLQPRFYEISDFKKKQSTLEAEGFWTLVEKGVPYQALPKGEPDVYLQGWCYQIR